MQVSRVAYDRFTLQLPACDEAPQPLSERSVAHDVACWLWQFGPTPLIALVEHEGEPPLWLRERLTVGVPWEGRVAAALVIEDRDDLERFLVAGAPHQRTHLLWPRSSPGKTFAALCDRGDAWTATVEGHARMADPEVLEVMQLQPV